MNINELKSKNLTELVEIGGDLDLADAERHAPGGARRADPPAAGRARRTGLRDRHPRHRRRGLRLPAPPRPDAQPGRRLRQLDARCAASACAPATGWAASSAPPRTARSTGACCASSRSTASIPRPRKRRPHFDALTPDPPHRADQPRDRPEEPQPAADQPGQPARQGPARPHRQPAQGRQDDAPQADRQRHQRELPGDPAHGRAHRRAAGGGHRHAPLASRARSSPRPSTSRRRTTPTSPRWPSRSPSARSRPGATW